MTNADSFDNCSTSGESEHLLLWGPYGQISFGPQFLRPDQYKNQGLDVDIREGQLQELYGIHQSLLSHKLV